MFLSQWIIIIQQNKLTSNVDTKVFTKIRLRFKKFVRYTIKPINLKNQKGIKDFSRVMFYIYLETGRETHTQRERNNDRGIEDRRIQDEMNT